VRFQHIRGLLDEADLAREYGRVRQMLADSDQEHLRAFLEAWDSARGG
jgi:hypothetical protein